MKKFHGPLYQVQLEEFLSVIKKLYQFYASLTPSPSKNKSAVAGTSSAAENFVETENEELESFLYDTNDHELDDLDELDKYMAEPLLKHNGPFDILSWWRGKTRDYPILSKIARDVMAIQVSTVASESAFSAGGRVVDPYRSSLTPDMVEALICTKDWIATERKDSKKLASMMTDVELLEAIIAVLNHEDGEKEDGFSPNDDAPSQRDTVDDYEVV